MVCPFALGFREPSVLREREQSVYTVLIPHLYLIVVRILKMTRKMSTAEEFLFERSRHRFYLRGQQLADFTLCLHITLGGKE